MHAAWIVAAACWSVPTVRTDFPTGSAKVEKIDADAKRIALSPGGDLKRGWVCWWHVRVDGLTAGETYVFDVGGGVWATPDRPTFSLDGKTWKQGEPGKRAGTRIEYRVRAESATLWLAWGPPFSLGMVREAAERLTKDRPYVRTTELCKSREGRSVPAIVVDETGRDDRPVIWVQARQHAWESGSSWVGLGFLEWLVSDDPGAKALRKQAVVIVVLVMDVDNVETGNGGKNQHPHDHNRDWSDEPVHPEVRAAIAWIRRLGPRVRLFLDLHNPAANDRTPFFFAPARELLSPAGRDGLDRWMACAVREMRGPLGLVAQPRESGKGYDKNWEKISTNWVRKQGPDGVVAVCLETSWNTPASVTDNYLRVGADLGRATARFLPPRE